MSSYVWLFRKLSRESDFFLLSNKPFLDEIEQINKSLK